MSIRTLLEPSRSIFTRDCVIENAITPQMKSAHYERSNTKLAYIARTTAVALPLVYTT